jgi:putative nucleotidyltransferase with HDIG domain
MSSSPQIQPRPSTSATPERATVLVVDDSNVLRGILREELEAEGFKVLLTEAGSEALDVVRDQRPDAVLLDVILPDTDGYEVCRTIKDDEALSHIPVLMLSSRNELKDKLAGFEAGADDYMAKPFFTKELVARLRTHLRIKESLESSRKLGQFYLEMLFGIGSTIISPFKTDDEMDIILRQALVAAKARRGSILLLDRTDSTLEVKGSAGYDPGPGPRPGDAVPISSKLPLVEVDGASTPIGIRMYEDEKTQTVFIPMVAKEDLIGGIEISTVGRSRRFSANEQKVLYALASQAAIVIENARLEGDVRSMFLNIIVSMAGAVDAKDAYTHGHSMRVARMALIVAQERGMAREEIETLMLSAILHDVGKIAIPDKVLKKAGRLDRQEFEIMKTHTTAGARMLSHIPALENVIPGILEHHEFWNGTGYPGGLEAGKISLAGRIIHIGDAFDAMTTDRIYRQKTSVGKALEEIAKFSGIQFDPDCVTLLMDAHRRGKVDPDLPKSTPTLHELIEQI